MMKLYKEEIMNHYLDFDFQTAEDSGERSVVPDHAMLGDDAVGSFPGSADRLDREFRSCYRAGRFGEAAAIARDQLHQQESKVGVPPLARARCLTHLADSLVAQGKLTE